MPSQCPFNDASFDFVHCNNVLDHTKDAAEVLAEIRRVLRPTGQLLLRCDVRSDVQRGGAAHPYRWSRETLQDRVLAMFDPVRQPVLMDLQDQPVADQTNGIIHRWVARLRLVP